MDQTLLRRAFFAFLLCSSSAAWAQAEPSRPLCPDRPGLNTPACTVEPGRTQIELSLGDWTRDRSAAVQTTDVLAGDMLARIGVSDAAELRIGWTAFGRQTVRDLATGVRTRDSGVGDLVLGVKYNLVSPDGSGTSIGLLPSVSLPTGSGPLTAGDWSLSLQVPASFELGGGVAFGVTPEIAAAVDSDGNGRHAAYALTGGFGFSPVNNLAVAIEAQLVRDEDPSGASTATLAGIALGYQTGDNSQIDFGSQFGLNENAADVQLYVGITRRF